MGRLLHKVSLYASIYGNSISYLPFQQSLAERQQLQEQNYQLQHKLADYFQKKKSDENRQDMDKNVTDQEQRYLKYMGEFYDS